MPSITVEPCTFALFGALGDLALRKLFPALYQLDRAGLLRYLVSFRAHNEFHEQCVERVFCDILARCRPRELAVWARYTRRGGLDINPFRTSHAGLQADEGMEVRQ